MMADREEVVPGVDLNQIRNAIHGMYHEIDETATLQCVYSSPSVVILFEQPSQQQQVEKESDDESQTSAAYSDEKSSSIALTISSEEEGSDAEPNAPEMEDGEDSIEPDEDEIIRQKLSVRAYHLPGNNWCEDWQMYLRNNHIVRNASCFMAISVPPFAVNGERLTNLL